MIPLICISHNIFLTREERYSLYEQGSIKVVGVSIPVWFYDKSRTSEPAKEIFCEYSISCEKKQTSSINVLKEGYEIIIGKNPDFNFYVPSKLKKFFFKNEYFPCAKYLLDIKDGGSEWLGFKVHDQKENMDIIHSIEIQKMESLLDSLLI